MKPYFAMYLPVEGGKKEGDLVQIKSHNSDDVPLPGHGTVHKVNKVDDSCDRQYLYTQEALIPSENCRKVKFFLCSRDIQVGDKVFLENGYNYFATVMAKVGGSDRDIILDIMPENRKHGTLDYREMIKVVGEISPEAHFVKEGDEFDEEDVYATQPQSVAHPERWVYWIKCPCCNRFA